MSIDTSRTSLPESDHTNPYGETAHRAASSILDLLLAGYAGPVAIRPIHDDSVSSS